MTNPDLFSTEGNRGDSPKRTGTETEGTSNPKQPSTDDRATRKMDSLQLDSRMSGESKMSRRKSLLDRKSLFAEDPSISNMETESTISYTQKENDLKSRRSIATANQNLTDNPIAIEMQRIIEKNQKKIEEEQKKVKTEKERNEIIEKFEGTISKTDLEQFKGFIKDKEDFINKGENGYTPFLLAILYNNFKIVELLYKNNKSVINTVIKENETALMTAIDLDRKEKIIDLLIDNAEIDNINYRNKYCENALTVAINKYNDYVVSKLMTKAGIKIEICNVESPTEQIYLDPIMQLIKELLILNTLYTRNKDLKNKNKKMINIIKAMRSKFDLNKEYTIDEIGKCNIFLIFLTLNNKAFFNALIEGLNEATIKSMANQVFSDGYTPLTNLIYNLYTQSVIFLISRSKVKDCIDYNIPNNYLPINVLFQTLYYIIYNQKDNINEIEDNGDQILLKKKKFLLKKRKEDITQYKNIIQILIKRGSDIEKEYNNETPLTYLFKLYNLKKSELIKEQLKLDELKELENIINKILI